VRRRAWALARVWLAAERVRHLVVLRAHLLSAARWADLAALLDPAGVANVWLVAHRFGLDPRHQAELDDSQATSGTGTVGRGCGAPVWTRCGPVRRRPGGTSSQRSRRCPMWSSSASGRPRRGCSARTGSPEVDVMYRAVLAAAVTAGTRFAMAGTG
jgi:hypothetical protein